MQGPETHKLNPFILIKCYIGSICTLYIWATVKMEGKYGESEIKQDPQECFWHANRLHESYETYEHYTT